MNRVSSSDRKKTPHVTVLVAALFLLSNCGDDILSPLLFQLRGAPTDITIAGVRLELEAALYRDFMPSSHPDSRLGASVWVQATRWPLPRELTIETVWVILSDSVWTTSVQEENRRSAVDVTVREGPEWPVGAVTDVVVHLVAADGEDFFLAARRKEIQAAF